MTKSLLLICLFAVTQIFAQTTERVEIAGKINVPVNAEAAGITVYNLTSQKGTVTDDEGAFTINAALNDRLSMSAVQYQPFIVIIDEGVIATRRLNVSVREAINELEKVIVRPYDLSGNVRVDIQRVEEPFFPDLEETKLQNPAPNYPIDRTTEVENIAINDPYMENGIQFVNIFKAIFLNNKEKSNAPQPRKDIEVQIRNMYKDEFFKEYIAIDKDRIDEFIFYAKNNGLSYQLLEKGNELDLIEFLIEEGKNFKQQNNKH